MKELIISQPRVAAMMLTSAILTISTLVFAIWMLADMHREMKDGGDNYNDL
jgi:hypothetical protein